jgi:hypothetical protein
LILLPLLVAVTVRLLVQVVRQVVWVMDKVQVAAVGQGAQVMPLVVQVFLIQ